MPKKKPVQKEEPPAKLPDNKTRFEIRMDKEILDRLQEVAKRASITTNQLAQGIMRWASEKIIIGEAFRDEDGLLHNKFQVGTVWFGNLSREKSEFEKEIEIVEAEHEDRDPELGPIKGDFYFSLDFTERKIIQEEI